MGLPELKQKIHNQVENADERILSIVSSVFDNYLFEDEFENTNQNPMTLSEKKAIGEALIQVAKKQTIPHDLVMEETQKRYPKYFKNEN